MVKLLRADLSHMLKTRCFSVCVILSLALSAVNSLTLNPGWENYTARLFFDGNSNSLLFTAIFAALFLGTGYSNGTMRNKLIIGSKRADIYLSNFITITLGSLVIHLAKFVPTIVTACFGKSFGMDANEFAADLITILFAIVAADAFFALLGMLITSKSANTAITITAVFVLIIGAVIILELLQMPEFVSNFEITENGVTQTDPMPNPAYVPPGAKRDILTAVTDILPTGQIMQMEAGEPHNKELMPLWSLGVLAVTTAAGVAVFRKKDLK